MRKNTKRFLCTTMASAMVLLCLAGCGESPASSTESDSISTVESESSSTAESSDAAAPQAVPGEPQYGGVVTIGLKGPQTVDRLGLLSLGLQNNAMIDAGPAMETLFRYVSGVAQPWLIESWDVSDDGLEYTFKCREGIQFHDGTPFNAEAVRWNLQLGIDGGNTAVSITSMEVIGDYELKLVIPESNLHFVDKLATSLMGYMYSPSAYEENGEEWAMKNPIGTGPYKFVSWEPNVLIEYEKNEDYWQEGLPYLDGVRIKYIEDNVALQTSFATGEIDMIHGPSVDIYKEIMTLEPNAVLERGETPTGIDYYWYQASNPDSPFSDVRVRQAFAHAIDREAIANDLLEGFGVQTTNQASYEGSRYFNADVTGYPYDPERAKELLAEAGYPDGFSTTISTRNTGNWPIVDEAAQAYLSSVGINVSIEFLEGAAFNEKMYEGWDNGIFGNPFSFAPDEFGRQLERASRRTIDGFGYKVSNWPEEYFDLMEQARGASDLEEAANYYQQAMKVAVDDNCTMLPLMATYTTIVRHENVHDYGVVTASANQWTPEKMWLG